MGVLLPPYSKTHILVFGSVLLLVGLALLVVLNQGLNVNQQSIPQFNTQSSQITATEVKNEYKEQVEQVQSGAFAHACLKGNFVIIDVRPQEEYDAGHIAGAINSPLVDLPNVNFDRDVDIVVYSDDQDEISKATQILSNLKMRYVHQLHDTIDGLKSHDYEIIQTENAL